MIQELKSCFIETLFPRRCPVCGEIVMPRGGLICRTCFPKLSFVSQPVCKKCGKEISCDTEEYCYDCTKHKHSFEYGRALLNYDDVVKHSIAQIKYNNKREYLDFYTEAIFKKYRTHLYAMNPDALIPVPVHPHRRRQRGFNQAELLAEGLGKRAGIPVLSDLLVRNKNTAPQKVLNPTERLKNLQEAFSIGVYRGDLVTVILVDDIYTTGSTIETCTRVLKRAGIKNVFFIVICIGRGR